MKSEDMRNVETNLERVLSRFMGRDSCSREFRGERLMTVS